MSAGRGDGTEVGRSELADRGVTRREAEVLDALADRLTNAEIAARLYVSERTVESHVSALLRKLQAANRLELGELGGSLRERAGGEHPARLPSTMALAAEGGSCVGRAEELQRLRRLWQKARSGQSLVAVVAGEAGIGKSRLVAELAAEVHGDGRVLLGSCFEDLQLPYQPIVDALTADRGEISPAERHRRVGPAGAILARIMPEEPGGPGGSAPSEVVDGGAQRAEIFGAVHGYLARAADKEPLLMVVEDVHWASATTRDLLRHLARAGGHAPILLVITTRDTPPEHDDDLALFLGDLARLPAVERISLSGLDHGGVAALLASLGSDADPSAVLAESGGNPLFVREIAAGGGPTGAPVAGLLRRRYARLAGDELALLDVAAVAGSEFDADILAAASGRQLVEVLAVLERSEEAGLVAAAPGRPGRFRFVHALFRSARYEAMGEGRRLQLHRQVMQALEARRDDDRVLPDLARHACLAAPLDGAPAAIDYARRAGALAERSLAFDEAATHYERALQVTDLLPSGETRTRLGLMVQLGAALSRMGDPRHRSVLLDAAAMASTLGATDALAHIAWAMSSDGTPPTPGRSDPDFVAIATQALSGLPSASGWRARTLAALAADCWLGGDQQRGRQLASDALSVAHQLDDPVTLGQVLLATRIVRWVPGGTEENLRAADDLVRIGRASGQAVLVVNGLFERALVAREQGDVEGFDEALEAFADMLDRAAMPFAFLQALLVGCRCTRQVWEGDLVAAEETATQMLSLASGGGFEPELWFGPLINVIRHNQGRLGEQAPRIEGFLQRRRPGFNDYANPLLALAYAHAGQAEEAASIVSQALSRPPAQPNLFWLSGMVMLCETAEMVGDPAAAAALGSQLAPFSGLMAGVFGAGTSPVDLALAQAALTAGDADAAESSAARAVAASRRRGTPVFLARELLRLAAARARRGDGSADVDHLVAEALAVGRQAGAGLVEIEARRMGW